MVETPGKNMVSRKMTGKDTPERRFWSTFIAHVIGSVDLVTILKPVEIIAKPTIMVAEMVKATMTEGTLAFNLAWNT